MCDFGILRRNGDIEWLRFESTPPPKLACELQWHGICTLVLCINSLCRVLDTGLQLSQQCEDREERGLQVEPGLLGGILQASRRRSQLSQKEGLQRGVVVEEGAR